MKLLQKLKQLKLNGESKPKESLVEKAISKMPEKALDSILKKAIAKVQSKPGAENIVAQMNELLAQRGTEESKNAKRNFIRKYARKAKDNEVKLAERNY